MIKRICKWYTSDEAVFWVLGVFTVVDLVAAFLPPYHIWTSWAALTMLSNTLPPNWVYLILAVWMGYLAYMARKRIRAKKLDRQA